MKLFITTISFFLIISCSSDNEKNKELDLFNCKFDSFSKTEIIYNLILNLDNESKIQKIDIFKEKNPESSYFEYNENLVGIKVIMMIEFIVMDDSAYYSAKKLSNICNLLNRTPDIRKGKNKLNFSIKDFTTIKNNMLRVILFNKNYKKLLLHEISKFKISTNYRTRKYLNIENEIYK